MSMKNFDYYQPASPEEAVKLLSTVDGTRAKSGGTDMLPMLKERLWEVQGLVNLMTIKQLAGIHKQDQTIRVGATTTIAALAESEQLGRDAAALRAAAQTTATPLVRNLATLGGNLAQRPRCWYFRNAIYECIKKGGSTCYAQEGENKYNAIFGNDTSAAVHPSNLAPALWALDAQVHVQGPSGQRDVPMAEFFSAPDENPLTEVKLERGEVISAVSFQALPRGSGSSYVEVREKQSYDWALVSAACRVDLDQGRIKDVRVVVSAVAPTPLRREAAEAQVRGQRLTEELAWKAGAAAVSGASPLRDNKYKVRMLKACVADALLAAHRDAEARR